MTPKEKAAELIEKYDKTINSIGLKPIKDAVLILVNEMIDYSTNKCCEFQNVKYWEEVKQELEKL